MKLHRLLLPKLYRRLDALKEENHKLKHRFDRVASIEYLPPASSNLYFENTPLHLPLDKVMIPYVLTNDSWQAEISDFVARILGRHAGESYYYLDIGANVGLTARQLLVKFPSIQGATCVEPDQENFSFLVRNCTPFKKAKFLNIALSDKDEQKTLFRHRDNIGCYSLLKEIIHDDLRTGELVIDCRKTSDEILLEDVPANARLIWKSDTEGYDELIASQLSPAFWQRVDVAIMELRPVAKPAYPTANFEKVLDSFPEKFLGANSSQPASTQAVMDYLRDDRAFQRGEKNVHCDLYMAR